MAVAMALVGVAWNFMFTGGTTLLLETYTPAEKAKVQGVNDFFVFGTVATCSLAAGAIYQFAGWQALNIAVVAVLIVVLAANLWIRLQRDPVPAE
ncbi:MAG: MFS transporter [Alphaproteobacteria bacterium]